MPRMPQAPPPGIVRNATPEATPGKWYDCNLIRFRGGQLQPIGGNIVLPGSVIGASGGIPRDLLTWHDNSHVRWAAFGTDAALYAYRFDTDIVYTITPTGIAGLDAPGALVGYGLGDYGVADYGVSRDTSDIGPQDIAATIDRKSVV